ncbi:hypothetical protein OC835_003182 [Tilletia horrida]|nr:hypothetical protein OC835_003182 [Tilletia horrida]
MGPSDHPQQQARASGIAPSGTAGPSTSGSSSSSSSSSSTAFSTARGLPISFTPPSAADDGEATAPYSQYDIPLPATRTSSSTGLAGIAAPARNKSSSSSDPAASAQSAHFRSLRSALQSLIHGHVLHREDMPPPPLPPSAAAAMSSSSSSSVAAAAAAATAGIETFLSTTRIFNSAAPVAAHLVALPQCTQDVVAILKFCNAHGLSPSIKSGGYATAGWSVQGDVVVDLSRMNAIDVLRPQDYYADKKRQREMQRQQQEQQQRNRRADALNTGNGKTRDGSDTVLSTSATRTGSIPPPLGTARTRKADEAFAPNPTSDDAYGPADPLADLEPESRKRLSPTSILSAPPLPSPAVRRVVTETHTGMSVGSSTGSTSATGSGRSGSGSSREGTALSGVTDATSEIHESESDGTQAQMRMLLSSASDSALVKPPEDLSQPAVGDMVSPTLAPVGRDTGALSSSSASSLQPSSAPPSTASSNASTISNRRNSAQQPLRTGLAEHLSWQRHHRPDGRASTHERVVLPESGPFVWRADGAGSEGGSSHSNLPSPSMEFANVVAVGAQGPGPAGTGAGSGAGPAGFSMPQPHQLSPTFPLTGPPSAFHAARAPSALLPTHSHEQPWQEARFRQQIEESAQHHRQLISGGLPSQTGGLVFAAGAQGSGSSHHPFDPSKLSFPNLVFPGSSLASATSSAALAAAAAKGGVPPPLPVPMPSGLASFLPPYNASPDGGSLNSPHEQHHHATQQQQQRTSPSTSPVVLRPGIYTRPYLLAVFGPGVGVRALDLATDEAGRTNKWDRNGWAAASTAGRAGEVAVSPGCDADGDTTLRAVESDGELGNGALEVNDYEPPQPDWEEPIRSTPYHCPLSAYPVGSTAMTTGGFGYISRAYGLSLDNLVEVELVLADGRVVVLNEGSKKRSKEEADLWWAVRGAAPCFGVVTRIVAKAYPIPSCFSGNLIFPFNPATAPSLIKHWRDCLKGVLPREMYTNLILVAGPNPSAHVIMIQICLLQSASEGETFVQAISSWTGERMLLKDVEERPFLAQQDGVAQVLKGGGGRRWMIRGDTLETLTDELIGQSVQRFKNATANRGVWLFELVNGAIADNAVEEEEEEEGEGDVEMQQRDTPAGAEAQATTGAAASPQQVRPSATSGRFTIPPLVQARVSPSSTTSADSQRVTKETCLAPSLRRAQFMVGALQQWDDYDEDRACVVSVDHWLRDAVSPISIGGPLPSFLERSETRERIASTFGEANLERLVRLKRAVDPTGLFRHTFAAGLSRLAGVSSGGAGAGPGGAGGVKGAATAADSDAIMADSKLRGMS